MSNISASHSDFDFWEFVCCGRCQLPFTSTTGATVPFWLTECGHIICNNHLNADQSCAHCGSPGVQVVPLQSEMEEPMSGWFRSMPVWLDGAANAIKFQQEAMASQIRYYRSRHQQQRVFIQQLKKANEALNVENNQLRQELGHGQYSDRGYNEKMSTDIPNSNGKRALVDAQSYRRSGGRPATTSSPRSVITPLGPNRLTLPQGQQAPNLSSNRFDGAQASSSHTSGLPGPDTSQAQQRSVGGFIEKYAYVPPSTPQFHPQRLTHTQAAPQTFKRSKPNEEPQQMRPQQQGHGQGQGQGHRNMPPPPTPVRFKPAGIPNSNATQHVRPGQIQAPLQGQGNMTVQRQQRSMGPPPTPQMRQPQARNFQGLQPNNASASGSARGHADSLPPTNRFQPPAQRFVPPPSAQGQHPGLPTLSTGNAPQRFIPSGSRAPSRAQPPDFSGGAQRMPFVSSGQGRDGYH
ncbi:hypothetical protein Hypma_011708 [Hypsizygus marmoreus]|uniref:Uncharacterized protein n=1 Tax=Hypsizygus marmoreus TaxID=39966 RepID=A0A369JQ38_HYPMA|nr:hypothetical protein Hypma_011708 [Hypsizygus marmoreus]